MELESGIAAFETKNFAHAIKLLSPIADEGNNEAFLLIGAADPEVVGSVSGFAPDFVLLLLAGLFASRVVNRRQSAS